MSTCKSPRSNRTAIMLPVSRKYKKPKCQLHSPESFKQRALLMPVESYGEIKLCCNRGKRRNSRNLMQLSCYCFKQTAHKIHFNF